MKKRIIQVIVTLFVCFFVTSTGISAEVPKTKDWQFDIAPLYLWMANLSGDMTIKGQSQSMDMDFNDVWDSLEGVFTVHFEGIYQKQWGFIFNLDYLNLSSSAATPAGPMEVDLKETMVELDVFYRFSTGSHTFDYLIGLRYTDVDAEALLVTLPMKGAGNEEWVDVIIGLRYLYKMSEKWDLSLRGDLGAGASDIAYQALGLINYQAWKNVSIFGGYRMLSTDYSSGSGVDTFKYDVTMHGPILGINLNW